MYVDSGIENLNSIVDPLFIESQLRRVLAQIDVTFSNSLIEAWWSRLKHQWLYLHQLDNITTVRRLVKFYVQQHNGVMPHSAFRGETPDEVYFEKASVVVDALTEQRALARSRRVAINQAAACPECPRAPPLAKAKRRVIDINTSSKDLGAIATGKVWNVLLRRRARPSTGFWLK